jgi:hypothetical protein
MKDAYVPKHLARAKQSVNATCCRGLSAVDERERLNRDRRALSGPVTVVEIVEVAAEALPEYVRAAKSQATVPAHGEARRVNGASLGGGQIEIGSWPQCIRYGRRSRSRYRY